MWSFSPDKLVTDKSRSTNKASPKPEPKRDQPEKAPAKKVNEEPPAKEERRNQKPKQRGKPRGDKRDKWTYIPKEEGSFQALPPGITEQKPIIEEEKVDSDDEAYQNFIAGSINVAGIKSNQKAVIGNVAPIEPKMIHLKQQPGEIDKTFWKDLDTLMSILEAKGHISDGSLECKLCKKKCKSNVKLLQHCWELHKDALSD